MAALKISTLKLFSSKLALLAENERI